MWKYNVWCDNHFFRDAIECSDALEVYRFFVNAFAFRFVAVGLSGVDNHGAKRGYTSKVGMCTAVYIAFRANLNDFARRGCKIGKSQLLGNGPSLAQKPDASRVRVYRAGIDGSV